MAGTQTRIQVAALTITAVDTAGMNVSDADLDTALNTVLPTLAKVAV